MADLIIDIPDGAGIGPGHEESEVQALQVQSGAEQQSNLSIQSTLSTTADTPAKDRTGDRTSSEGSFTLTPEVEGSPKKTDTPESVPSVPESPHRWYFEETEPETSITRELEPAEEYKLPVSLTSSIKYTSWKLPVPEKNRGLYNVVLGVSIKDFNVEAIEAVIVTIEQNIRGIDNYKSEIIGPAELKKLCAAVANSSKEDSNIDQTQQSAGLQENAPSTTVEKQTDVATGMNPSIAGNTEESKAMEFSGVIANEAGGETTTQEEENEDEKKERVEEREGEGMNETILWWKLRENFSTQERNGTFDMVIEIKTWNDMPSDYGALKLHCVELHVDAHPLYREHRPFLGYADINRTGYAAHDKIEGDPKTVSGACMSRFQTRLLIIETSGATRTLQLWDLEDPDTIPVEPTEPPSESDQVAAVAGDSKSRRPSADTNTKPTEKSPRPSTDANAESSARPSTDTSRHNATEIPLLESVSVDLLSGDTPVVTSSAADELQAASSKDQPSDEAAATTRQVDVPREPYTLRLLAWTTLSQTDDTKIELALSADGTQVVLQDVSMFFMDDDERKNYKNLTQVLRYTPESAPLLNTDPSTGFGFSPLDVGDCWPKLESVVGKSDFYIIDPDATDVKDELFFTYNGVTVEIYSVYERWSHVRSIVIDPYYTPATGLINPYSALAKQLRGKYLIVENWEQSQVTTWDIEEGRRVSFITNLLPEQYYALSNISSLSREGTLIAIPGKRFVSFYRTLTWTLIGTCVFEEIDSDDQIGDTMFVNNDTQLIVSVASGNNQLHRTNRDFVVDVMSMKVIGRHVAAGTDVMFNLRTNPSTDQRLCWIGDSTVDVYRLHDRFIDSPSKARERCDGGCNDVEAFGQGKMEAVSSSGLNFKFEKLDAQVSSHGRRDKVPLFTATVTDQAGLSIQKLTLPFPKDSRFLEAGYYCDCKYLVVAFNMVVFVWSAPATMEHEFTLLLVHRLLYEFKWNICSHEELHLRHSNNELVDNYSVILGMPCRYQTTYPFLEGIQELLSVYEHASDTLKQDIIRYAGECINIYPDPNFLVESVVPWLCVKWTPETNVRTLAFMTALLESPLGRWVPLPDMPDHINPVRILLNHATTHPRAIAVAEVIIDYCIRQARVEKDLHFLVPVRRCLHDLTDPKKPYSEIALKALRGFGYFPARGRRVILDYHVIAHPYEFRWRFWKPNPRGLHQYKDQVLQISAKMSPTSPKDNFTRDIFTASFDMLWHRTGPEGEPSEELASTEVHGPNIFSWPMAFIAVIRRKLKVTHNTTVECHSFDAAALDNPALTALVEYKWNTIGHSYWLFRFLAQCCFYDLVLAAVLLQIYGFKDNGAYEGIFIAIIVSSVGFVWLEILQLLKDRRGYMQSIYNTVDLLAFLFPLAGSINQLCIIWGATTAGLNPPLLSFSVLFIFLHFLFELRVIRGVCQFVSIIIKALSSIRVFFFVFAGGLLGFSIAILHLLHACIGDECPASSAGFSDNMLRAISMTYFMMGGRYDPIDNGFGSDNVGFHLMMIIFFFFTVILMLNVLIALINHAIDDGDQTWQLDWLQNRMRYVESAENMTYDIPGFRSSNDWFPETIYYTGTPQQVRDYEKETRRLVDESAPVAIAVTVAEDAQDQQVNMGSSETSALLALLKQYHDDQMKNHEIQAKQFDEQKETIAELRTELQLLRERVGQLQH
ncbi:hypothetical protein BG015_004858 [Linnemannia schmuckeri]|uniref:Ion transport domain-containing protein n=1 Tax=Linnemannia schmuckeri TaxID=64567 RepID=A0A9P5S1S5_9FUNG|nr:hypothetical protein BG015_004858 [Linnemannia schmuckeri]